MTTMGIIAGVIFVLILMKAFSGSAQAQKNSRKVVYKVNSGTRRKKARKRKQKSGAPKGLQPDNAKSGLQSLGMKNKKRKNGAKKRNWVEDDDMMWQMQNGVMVQQMMDNDLEEMNRMSNPYLTPGLDIIVDECAHGIDRGAGIVNPEHNFEAMDDSFLGSSDDGLFGGSDDSFFGGGFGGGDDFF